MAEKKIYLGELSDMFGKMTTEDDVLNGMMALGSALKAIGYELQSGKVSEGKVDELWAVKYVTPDSFANATNDHAQAQITGQPCLCRKCFR